MGRGKPLSNEVRNVLYKVLTYFEMEKRNKYILLPLHRALKRTAVATGVPERTIRNIKKEALKIKAAMVVDGSPDTETINFAYMTRKRKSPKKRLDIDDDMIEGIKKIIYRFQSDHNEVLTVKKILLAARNEYNFPGQIDTLRRLLKDKLGCKFRKTDNGRWELILGTSHDPGSNLAPDKPVEYGLIFLNSGHPTSKPHDSGNNLALASKPSEEYGHKLLVPGQSKYNINIL